MTKKQYKRYVMKALRAFKVKYVPDKKMMTDRISVPKWAWNTIDAVING